MFALHVHRILLFFIASGFEVTLDMYSTK